MKIIHAILISASLVVTSAVADTLKIKDGEIHKLKPGTYAYDHIELGRGSMILITGSTRLNTKKLSTMPGARIEYAKGAEYHNTGKFLEFVALDCSEMRGVLSISGTGADGKDGAHGGNGNNGKKESLKTKYKWVKVGPLKTKVPDGITYVRPTKGGHGGHGGHGQNGEEAMDIDVSFYKVDPSAQVILTSNGGRGGDGGNGGSGGKGGSGSHFKGGENGGNGGNGGNAGNGGDAGNISVSLIYKDGTPKEELKKLKDFLDKNIHAIPGLGGRKGVAGAGGTGGDGGAGGKIGGNDIGIKQGGGNGGSSGRNGKDAGNGDNGTTKKELMEGSEWAKVHKKAVDSLLK